MGKTSEMATAIEELRNAAAAIKNTADWLAQYFSNPDEPEQEKQDHIDPYEHKVLGVTAMTRLLGKAKFDELLGGLIEKPQGKPTLVPKSDKRPALKNNAATAADDFKEDN